MALRRVRRSMGEIGKTKKKKVKRMGRYVIINGKAYPYAVVKKKKKKRDEVFGAVLFNP